MPPARDPKQPLALAICLSGSGRTFQNIADHIQGGRLNATIKRVISSKPGAAGLDRAAAMNIAAHVVARKQHDSVDSFSEAIFDHVRQASADLVCLAGWLSLIRIPDDFAHRVINIHPALLPSFGGRGMYGRHVHEAVLAAGCKVSGCTVHFADQTYDTGPIIVQRTCPVRPSDTPQKLAARVFKQECKAYPQAIGLIAAGRVAVEGRLARILPKS